MKSVQIRSAANGFIVVVPPTMKPNEPMAPAEDMVFNTWDQVTAFLTEQGFIK